MNVLEADLLSRSNMAPIQHDQGLAMYKDIGAKFYLECSAITGLGVKTVFEHAMRLARMSNLHESEVSEMIV